MKKLTFFFALMACVIGAQAANEIYTEWNSGSKTLTYYYDANRASRTGTTEVYDQSNPDKIRFEDYYYLVKTVVINESMKDAPLTTMRSFFFGGTLVASPYTSYALSNLTSIEGMENLNTSNVTDMSRMFVWCNNLTSIDLTSFDFSKVTNTSKMFYGTSNGASHLTTIYCNANLSGDQITNSSQMFSDLKELVGGNGTKYDVTKLDKTYARPDGEGGEKGYFTKLERKLYGAFTDASKKTLVLYYDNQKDTRDNVSDWPSYYSGVDFLGITKAVFDESIKIARPTTTEDWFIDCETLASIEHLEYLNTSKVTTMYNMFRYCKALTAINVNSFDISSLTNTTFMFLGCENLVYIICDKNWNTGAITESDSWGMFDGCEKLKGGNGTTYNDSKDKIGYAHPDVVGDPGYFITEAQYKTATGMDNVQSDKVQGTKVLRDGQLLILRDGKMYNVMGVEIR